MVADPVRAAPPPPHGDAVLQAAARIRSLVLQRRLLPGVQVRQEELAAQIGVSRGPTREALRILAAEGLLTHEPNRGFSVSRLTVEEMNQVYLIRDLLETEILRRLPPAAPETLERLRAINTRIASAGDDLDLAIALNSQFHDALLSLSELTILKAELHHIGSLTTAYQALSLSVLSAWELLISDHEKIIGALEDHNNDELVAICREHRERSLTRLAPLLR